MNFEVSQRLWDSTLEPHQKHVANAFAHFAKGSDPELYAFLSRIARMTGHSRRHVRRVVAELKQSGVFVEIGRGPRGSVKYRFNWKAKAFAPGTPTSDGTHVSQGVGRPCPRGEDAHVPRGRTSTSSEFRRKENRQGTVVRKPPLLARREDQDRKKSFSEARRLGLRNFETHPCEDWEAPMSEAEKAKPRGTKVQEASTA